MSRNWNEIDQNMALGGVADPQQLVWYDPRQAPFQIRGLYWHKTNHSWHRLPDDSLAMLAQTAPGVCSMGKTPAGGQIAFETDAQRIVIHGVLASGQTMDHMTATGEMGVDCYAAYPGEPLRFEGVTRLDGRKNEYTSEVMADCGRQRKQIVLNLPLYQPLLQLEIGLEGASYVAAPRPLAGQRPIVMYGSSITQGGCVSRPGAMSTNILSRRLDMEFLNFGFSGSGKGEPEVAQLLAMVEDPAMYILSYEANAEDGIYTTLVPFLNILRQKHPQTPILVCSRVYCHRYAHTPREHEALCRRRAFQRQTVEELTAAGDKNLFFVDGWLLMDQDCADCFVDGIHPTDLGARQVADRLEREIRSHLPESAAR